MDSITEFLYRYIYLIRLFFVESFLFFSFYLETFITYYYISIIMESCQFFCSRIMTTIIFLLRLMENKHVKYNGNCNKCKNTMFFFVRFLFFLFIRSINGQQKHFYTHTHIVGQWIHKCLFCLKFVMWVVLYTQYAHVLCQEKWTKISKKKHQH